MAGRIPWGRYSGDEIEAVVAMMLNREHPNSVRVAPSRGDGGVDILDRGSAGGRDVVYQVKGFADRKSLASSDRAKIGESLRSLFDENASTGRWSRLDVGEWRLVMPLDPTPEDLIWLANATSGYGVIGHWDGLAVVDQLAAKYPDVVDYYLNGGSSSIAEAYREVVAIMSLGPVAAGDVQLDAPEVAERVQSALRALDHDPHYQYEFHFGHGDPPEPSVRQGLVMSWSQVNRTSATWFAVDVMARCAASTSERPITINGQIDVTGDPAVMKAVQDFVELGSPFESPLGAYSGVLNAPGGLGGTISGALIRISPIEGGPAKSDAELTFQIVSPDGQVLAQADMDRTQMTSGAAGARSVMAEVSGAFEMTVVFNLREGNGTISLRRGDLVGLSVVKALSAAEFITNFRFPNSLRFAQRGAPMNLGVSEAIPRGREDLTMQSDPLLETLKVLNLLQQRSPNLLRVPTIDQLLEQQQGWKLVASLLDGRPVTQMIKEDDVIHVLLPAGSVLPRATFRLRVPLRVQVGSELFSFGHALVEFADPQVLSETVLGGGDLHACLITPGRTVTYFPDEDASDPS